MLVRPSKHACLSISFIFQAIILRFSPPCLHHSFTLHCNMHEGLVALFVYPKCGPHCHCCTYSSDIKIHSNSNLRGSLVCPSVHPSSTLRRIFFFSGTINRFTTSAIHIWAISCGWGWGSHVTDCRTLKSASITLHAFSINRKLRSRRRLSRLPIQSRLGCLISSDSPLHVQGDHAGLGPGFS